MENNTIGMGMVDDYKHGWILLATVLELNVFFFL